MLVHSIADPVNTGIITDGFMGGVNKNDLEVLIHCILVNPVRVEDTESAALAANALLSMVAEVAGRLQLGDTSVDRLTIVNTLQIEIETNNISNSSKSLSSEHVNPQKFTAEH